MLSLLITSFTAVFVAELIGDKSTVAIGALATRYRALPVFTGLTIAFMGKMLVAVLAGQAIGQLPPLLVGWLGALAYFAGAMAIWRERPEEASELPLARGNRRAVYVSFATIFFSEWADVGQLAAATLAGQSHAPGIVWTGSTAALVTKGALAMTVGAGLSRWVPRTALRYGALCVCLTLGVLSVLRLES